MKRKLTVSQEQYKKNLIQKIQINKSNVFSDDEERKEFMFSRFRVDSTTKMSIDQLKIFLDFCLRNVSDIPMFNKAGDKEFITQAQKEKIRTVWKNKANKKSEEALLCFVSKVVAIRSYCLMIY